MFFILSIVLYIFSSVNLNAVDLLIDTGIGISKLDGIGQSGNSARPVNFMIGGRAKIYTGSGKYFYAPGMRINYFIANRDFINTSISTRTDGVVYEQWSLTGIDSFMEFGRKFNKYELSGFASIGVASFFYEGIFTSPSQQLAKTRDTGLGFSFGISNGIELTNKLALRLELGYKWYYFVNPVNPSIKNIMITFQYIL